MFTIALILGLIIGGLFNGNDYGIVENIIILLIGVPFLGFLDYTIYRVQCPIEE